MRRTSAGLVAALLGACTGSGTLVVPPDGHSAATCGGPGAEPCGTDTVETALPTLEQLAEADGDEVRTGTFTFATTERCCDPGVSCLWNNPATPYGVYRVPQLPGEPPIDVPADGWSGLFRMRADEAVVYLGRSPPRARYFSWRSYLQYRMEPSPLSGELLPLPVLGSLGPSLNQLVVGERTGAGGPWDAPMAVVTTADAAVERKVVGWLVQAGWDPADVQVDRIPPSIARLGVGPDADLLTMVTRVAIYDEPAAGAAWQADPGATVLRITPREERPVEEPHPRQELPVGGSGVTEARWADAASALSDAVRRGFPGYLVLEQASNPLDCPTYDCIDSFTCFGDLTDRYNSRVPSFFLEDDGSFALAYGVNHERAGKASYANVAANTVVNQIGLASVDSPDLPGSARAFLDDPLVDDLYVVAVARDCAAVARVLADEGHGGAPVPCLEVPTTCPGVPYGQPVMVNFRAYLEPSTGAAPLAGELVLDRVAKIVPRP